MANPESLIRLVHATPPTPGAIAILQLIGDGCENLLHAITGVRDWPIGRARLASLAGIDDGLAVMLAPRVAQLMPHGGPRVVQRLAARLRELGVEVAAPESLDPRELFPEAEDRFEALMLVALSRAASGLAIDLLPDQPRRWREFAKTGGRLNADDLARSRRLNRLIDPPMVVLAGEPNVGKSTLSNALFGRTMSIAADMPGTTRDYVTGRIDLAGLTVDWHDTPGILERADAIERNAIDIARRLMERADLLIAMRDTGSDWPRLPREADLQVINKCDERAGLTLPGGQPLRISALHGHGLAALVTTMRDRLVAPEDLANPRPWLFDSRLQH